MLHNIRSYVMPTVVGGVVLFAVLGAWLSPWFWLGLVIFIPALFVGIFDLIQKKHSITRNYPVIGHFRFMLEGAGPELHQYFVESNTSGRPFDRDTRTLMYQRAKDIESVKPFGTELDVYAEGYGFITHSMAPKEAIEDASLHCRVEVGGPEATQPYSASIVNISAMSFGALSGNAIEALNTGAKMGGFAHDTGEGGFSRYHKAGGGDIIWQIGTGYFGARNDDGTFNVELFREQAADPQVKMIELKVSQGAKPSHGGILPGIKVSPEIAEARKVPVGQDCISPPGHSAYSTPVEMMEFIQHLREESGGKPTGFKICIGNPQEFFAICKAMIKTGITPDFITVDGSEGGTGAAPIEFSDFMGFPMREALIFVDGTMRGFGLRDRMKIAASGKRVNSYAIAVAMALGADWVNIARGFMFSVGCIQSQSCHTNTCPVGVATQDQRLEKALIVPEKAERVYNFHKNTVDSLAEMTAACGLSHPNEFSPKHLYERVDFHEIKRFDQLYDIIDDPEGAILEGRIPPLLSEFFDSASADTFQPV